MRRNPLHAEGKPTRKWTSARGININDIYMANIDFDYEVCITHAWEVETLTLREMCERHKPRLKNGTDMVLCRGNELIGMSRRGVPFLMKTFGTEAEAEHARLCVALEYITDTGTPRWSASQVKAHEDMAFKKQQVADRLTAARRWRERQIKNASKL